MSPSPPPVGLELVFTVAEEDGLRGAKELDISIAALAVRLRARPREPDRRGDHRGADLQAAGRRVQGHEAHAGIRPEDGRSAIAAAAAAIAAMKLGRLDEETTANVGMIEGGTASNVVAGPLPDRWARRGASTTSAPRATIGAMVDACTWAASEHGCDVDVEVSEMFRGYRLDPRSEAVALASEALGRCGHEPREVATGGGSDANALVAAGSTPCCSPTAPRRTTRRRRASPRTRIVEMLRVCEARDRAGRRC